MSRHRHTLYTSQGHKQFHSLFFSGMVLLRPAVIFLSHIIVRSLSPLPLEKCQSRRVSLLVPECWLKRSPVSRVSSASSCDSETIFSPASRWAPSWRRPPPAVPALGICWSGTLSPARSAVWWWSWCGWRCAGLEPRTRKGQLWRELDEWVMEEKHGNSWSCCVGVWMWMKCENE